MSAGQLVAQTGYTITKVTPETVLTAARQVLSEQGWHKEYKGGDCYGTCIAKKMGAEGLSGSPSLGVIVSAIEQTGAEVTQEAKTLIAEVISGNDNHKQWGDVFESLC